MPWHASESPTVSVFRRTHLHVLIFWCNLLNLGFSVSSSHELQRVISLAKPLLFSSLPHLFFGHPDIDLPLTKCFTMLSSPNWSNSSSLQCSLPSLTTTHATRKVYPMIAYLTQMSMSTQPPNRLSLSDLGTDHERRRYRGRRLVKHTCGSLAAALNICEDRLMWRWWNAGVSGVLSLQNPVM